MFSDHVVVGFQFGRVAGTTVPAFVERSCASRSSFSRSACVAGTTVPAFVERLIGAACVGPMGLWTCRRDYGPGLR